MDGPPQVNSTAIAGLLPSTRRGAHNWSPTMGVCAMMMRRRPLSSLGEPRVDIIANYGHPDRLFVAVHVL